MRAIPRTSLEPLELRQLTWLLGGVLHLLSLVSVFGLRLGAEPAALATLVAVVTVLLQPGLPGRVPRWAWRLLTGALVAWVVTDVVRGGSDFLPPLLRTLILISALRAVQYRTRREDLQLVLLSMITLIISGALSLELLFALQVLLYTPLAMLCLAAISLTTHTCGEAATGAVDWQGFRWARFAQHVRRAIDRRLLLFSGLLFLGLCLVSAVFFVTLPRFNIGQNLPFLKARASQSLSGFSEAINIGEMTDLLEDDTIAMRVDLPPDWTELRPYWRMVVMDEYHGGGFRSSEAARRLEEFNANYRFPLGLRPRAGSDMTVYLEGGVSRYLPLPGAASAVRFPNRVQGNYNRGVRTLHLQEIPAGLTSFQIEAVASMPSLPASPADAPLLAWWQAKTTGQTPNPPQGYPGTTVQPAANPAARATFAAAAQAIDPQGTLRQQPGAFAQATVAWLQQGRGYSLRSVIPPGQGDSLSRWVAARQPGHCELFAGSMTMICRAAGIPTRMVVGFAGGDRNAYESYLMVRQRHAHAWVEVFDPDDGWVRFDPTPGNRTFGDDTAALGLLNQGFSAYLDSLRLIWYRRVVNFDAAQQQELVLGAKDAGTSIWKRLQERWNQWMQAREETPQTADAGSSARWERLAPGALTALVLGLAVLAVPGWRRRRWTPEERCRRVAGRLLRGLSPQALAQHQEVLELIRYGPAELWPQDPQAVLRRARRQRPQA